MNIVKENKIKNSDELIYVCDFYLFCPFCCKVQQMDEDYEGPVLRYDELVMHPAKPYPESMDVNPSRLLCVDEYGENLCVEYY